MKYQNLGHLLQVIRENKQKTILIRRLPLSAKDLLDIEDAFAVNTRVTKLLFNDCDLQPEVGIILGRIVARHPAIYEVELNCNCLGDQGIADFCKGAVRSKTLKFLSLDENDLTAEGVQAIRMLLMYGSLQYLSLENNYKLGDKGIEKLFANLKWSHPLLTLYLGNNSITALGANSLAAYIASNPKLTALFIGGNPIGDAGLVAISLVLQNLEFLGCSDCEIGNFGAIMLGKALAAPRANRLYELDLSANKITHLGLALNAKEGLAVSLANNTTLLFLDLSDNQLGDKGAAAVAKLITATTVLDIIILCSNAITVKGGYMLAGALAGNITVTDFDLSNNPIGSGAQKFAQTLRENESLTNLRLNNVGINDQCAQEFIDALNLNIRLQSLELDRNAISSDNLSRIETLTTINSTKIADSPSQDAEQTNSSSEEDDNHSDNDSVPDDRDDQPTISYSLKV